MKHLAEELIEKVEESIKDTNDFKKLIHRVPMQINTIRKDHPCISGSIECAIGIAAIAAGASHFNHFGSGGMMPELVSAAFGAGVGGGVGGIVTSLIGGIGVAMMGTAFSIPASAIIGLGIGIGALSGSVTGWLGVDLASQAPSLMEILFDNIAGAALVTFGCYMLFLGMKDLWKAGGEFIAYLKTLGINEIPVEELS